MVYRTYIFSWCATGIEAVVPLDDAEDIDHQNMMASLAGSPTKPNPMNGIIFNLMARARLNPQRNYEIYAINSANEMDEAWWWKQWVQNPQGTADLVRERGHQLYSDRIGAGPVII